MGPYRYKKFLCLLSFFLILPGMVTISNAANTEDLPIRVNYTQSFIKSAGVNSTTNFLTLRGTQANVSNMQNRSELQEIDY